MRVLRSGMTAVTGAALWATAAQACSIPVFRYALEWWPADPYQVVVFHRGPLSQAQKALLTRLEGRDPAAPHKANLDVVAVDLQGAVDAGAAALWKEQQNARLPCLVVRYPTQSRLRGTVWAGDFDAGAVSALVDSPKRRELAKRLVGGDSVVWLLLEIGDRKADDAAAEVLQAQLSRLEKTLKLPEEAPEGEEEDKDKLEVRKGPPLKPAFSMLRLARSDPAERMLVEMLLNTEDDLKGLMQPMAFAVFGRGRVMEALVGPGINAENVSDVSTFLVGPCSCRVKRLAPGTDVVTAIDWEAELIAAAANPPATTAGASTARAAGAETAKAGAGPSTSVANPTATSTPPSAPTSTAAWTPTGAAAAGSNNPAVAPVGGAGSSGRTTHPVEATDLSTAEGQAPWLGTDLTWPALVVVVVAAGLTLLVVLRAGRW